MSRERAVQCGVAALMVLTAAALFALSLGKGVAAIVGSTVVGAILAGGAVVLSQDRRDSAP